MSNAEIRVIASGGLKAAYVELVPVFERERAEGSDGVCGLD